MTPEELVKHTVGLSTKRVAAPCSVGKGGHVGVFPEVTNHYGAAGSGNHNLTPLGGVPETHMLLGMAGFSASAQTGVEPPVSHPLLPPSDLIHGQQPTTNITPRTS
jgi:hypothetical protein